MYALYLTYEELTQKIIILSKCNFRPVKLYLTYEELTQPELPSFSQILNFFVPCLLYLTYEELTHKKQIHIRIFIQN